MNKRLILVRGLPGSGKTTKAKQIIASNNNKNIILFEADMFHIIDGKYQYDVSKASDAHDWCRTQAACHLNKGLDVVVANTFTTMAELRPYIEVARRYGADTLLVETRGNFKSEHGVPAEVIEKMRARWEEYDENKITAKDEIIDQVDAATKTKEGKSDEANVENEVKVTAPVA